MDRSGTTTILMLTGWETRGETPSWGDINPLNGPRDINFVSQQQGLNVSYLDIQKGQTICTALIDDTL